ncbi:MAG: peptide deformylase [Alphaproteobacteria bacterium]
MIKGRVQRRLATILAADVADYSRLRGVVPRHAAIRYRGTTPVGEPVEREATGLHARVVQHEVDHLDGVLFLDRMTDLTTLVFESEMRHLRADDDEDLGDDGSEVTA